MKKEKIIFGFGIFNLLGSVLLTDQLDAFLFFLIIAILCFMSCRKLLFKLLCGSVVKRKIELMKQELYLRKEVDLLIRKKNTLELFISDNDKYVNEIIDYDENVNKLKKQINELEKQKDVVSERVKKQINNLEIEKEKLLISSSFQEKRLKQNIQVLKSRKENLEDFMKQEEVISRAIRDKSELFDILSIKNENLKQQNENLKNEIQLLQNQMKQTKQKVSFSQTISLEYIDNLDGFEFEDFTKDLLESLGFNNCRTTQSTGDYGIDVIAEKDGIMYGIQCKKYKNEVGNKAIQEAYSGKNYYNCHVAVVLTNNYFTSNAINQAEKNGVVLWDRDKLKEFTETLT